MTTHRRHHLVEDYLADLERCASRLPRDQRGEILSDIRAHVDAAAADVASEADIRNMLEDLGDPEHIVGAAAGPARWPGDAGPTGRLALAFGIAALVFFPVLGIPFGITAVVLGVRARRHLRSRAASTTMATSGVVTGAVAVVLPILVVALLVSTRSSTPDAPNPPEPLPAPTTVPVPATTAVG